MPRGQSRHAGPAVWWRAVAASAVGLALGVTVLSAPAGAESTPGVTSSSIAIGATVPLTGPAAPGYDEIAPAMNAVFDYVNAHGGVYGRKIHYTYLDDGYNPTNTAQFDAQARPTGQHLRRRRVAGNAHPVGRPTLPQRAEGPTAVHRVGL